jgi:membrane-associated protease RseP (regulator of RpoE activity)
MDDKEDKKEKKSRPWVVPLLFVVTLITTTLAGAEWMYGRMIYFEPGLTFDQLISGVSFSFPFLAILTVHEFGHYLTARYYRVKVTLPFYIPFWLGFIGMPSIGTMGAFIRIKEPIKSRKEYFDIGIAGPLAGFIAALLVLYYGFTHLPPADYIYSIHPEYEQYGADYADHVYQEEGSFYLGDNLTFLLFKKYVAPDPSLVPNPYEIIHYPWLFAGFLALFFTALNLLPIGQLDGGHALYGLFGWENHKLISTAMFILFLYYAGIGLVTPFDPLNDLVLYVPLYVGFLFIVMRSMRMTNRTRLTLALAIFTAQFLTILILPEVKGYTGWLVFAFIIGRFLGIYHPPAILDRPLTPARKILGWITLIVFILSFSPRPFVIT